MKVLILKPDAKASVFFSKKCMMFAWCPTDRGVFAYMLESGAVSAVTFNLEESKLVVRTLIAKKAEAISCKSDFFLFSKC